MQYGLVLGLFLQCLLSFLLWFCFSSSLSLFRHFNKLVNSFLSRDFVWDNIWHSHVKNGGKTDCVNFCLVLIVILTNPSIYIYIYIYMCVCVCVCVWLGSSRSFKHVSLNNKAKFCLYDLFKIISRFLISVLVSLWPKKCPKALGTILVNSSTNSNLKHRHLSGNLKGS